MSQDETAVNEEVVAEPTTPDSAPVETSPEVADPLEALLKSDDDEPTKAETEEKPDVEEPAEEPESEETPEPEAEEQPQGKAEDRKQQLNGEIRDLVAQKNALRTEVEQLNSQVYKPQTVEELVEEGYSESVAEVKALKQELELQAYNNKVVEAQTALSEQSGQVLKDFPMFNPDSEEFDEQLAAGAAEALRASLIIDPNTNQIIGSHLTPYQIYKPIADAYSKSQIQGRIKGQKATEQMLSQVDARPSATPKTPKVDPLLEILSSDD